jgi:hypothetical protein
LILLGLQDEQRVSRPCAKVPGLLELAHRVQHDVVAVAVEPDDRRLEPAVRHLRGEGRRQRTIQEIGVARRSAVDERL